MNNNGHTAFRPRNSPTSDRYLDLFTQSQPSNPSAVIGDEFDEDDVFWTGNFSESDRRSDTPPKLSDRIHRSTVRRADSSGIRAALHGDEPRRSPSENRLLCRKISFPSSSSSSRMIPAIPKPQSHEREYHHVSVSAGNYRHSAPVNVPMRQKGGGKEAVVAELREDDGERLPPHEIVARASSQAEMTFSVLEGVGRTLKGRDLRQVRNAVWRQTGFLD